MTDADHSTARPSSDPTPESTETGDVFVAAQPIFDRQTKVYGHELLFRSGPDNFFPPGSDPDQATSNVIATGLGMIGLEALTGGAHAFVNLPRNLLVNDFAFILPRQRTVVEILETVKPDREVIEACRRLKRRGYKIALDDFVDEPEHEVLLQFTDFVKVDFQLTAEAERKAIARRFIRRGIRMLAEKVETQEEVTEASAEGYKFFQGYFFSKPMMVAARDVPGFRLNYLRLLRELNRPQLDFDQVEEIVSHELSISYRVLRAINSAAFGLRSEVKSIRQALVLLGPEQMRKWACVWGLAGLGQDRPVELIVSTIRRARFCELLGGLSHLDILSTEFFLLGLFSTIDAIMGRPKEEILEGLSVPTATCDALLGADTPLGSLLACAIGAERGDWDACSAAGAVLDVTEAEISKCYLEASAFARDAFNPSRPPKHA